MSGLVSAGSIAEYGEGGRKKGSKSPVGSESAKSKPGLPERTVLDFTVLLLNFVPKSLCS